MLVAGILRLGLTTVRRLVAGKVSLAVEFDLRGGSTSTCRPRAGFFDSQQTGQLMSRATVDLQSIRFFLGYGLIFITQNALTIVLAAIVMFSLNPPLARSALAPVPFVVFTAAPLQPPLAARASRRSSSGSPELTAEAEENVSGVRIVKAFAARSDSCGASRARCPGSSTRTCTRPAAGLLPADARLPRPASGSRSCCWVGGRQVINGTITLGAFTAFYTYLVMLIGPMRMLGMALGMAQRAVASGNRLFEILDREPQITARPAPAAARGRGRVEFRGATLRYDGAALEALSDVDLEVAAGLTVAVVGRPGPARPAWSCSSAPLRRDLGRGLVDGADVRDVDPASLRAQIAFVADDPFLFSATVPRTSPTPAPTPPTPRSRRRRAARRPRTSSCACRTATRRASASAA